MESKGVSGGKAIQRATEEFKKIVAMTNDIATSFGVKYIATEFFLLAIVKSSGRASMLLRSYNVTETTVLPYVRNCVDKTLTKVGFTVSVKKLINSLSSIADANYCSYISTEHFLYAILSNNCIARDIIFSTATDVDSLKENLLRLMRPSSQSKSFAQGSIKGQAVVATAPKSPSYSGSYSQNPQNANKSYSQSVSSASAPSISGTPLEKYGVDLTEQARLGRLDPVIGRKEEMQSVVNALNRKNKNSPLLVGEPGIGKSAVIEGFAELIVSGNVPDNLKNKILFSLDLSSIVAGAKFRGEFEARFKEVIKYVTEVKNVILFIDEIHNLVSGGKSDGMDASEILKPMLARGELQLIGATTIQEYRKFIEKDAALDRRFSVINLEPPTVSDTIEIIKGLRDNFEAHHQIEITDDAIETAVKLSDRYITTKFLPDKAIDLIDEAAARSRLQSSKPDTLILQKEEEFRQILGEIDYARSCGYNVATLNSKLGELQAEIDELYKQRDKRLARANPFIDGEDVAKVVSDTTKIPVAKLTQSQAERLLNLENILHERVVGQEQAVTCVSQAVRRAMSGIADPNKPIGTFMFVGPTGVGKTELSKALTEALFSDDRMLIRIDMSEYMEKSSVSKLIGAPPGYVGFDEEGQLTEKVRRNPYCVVLFDEIEKAHPDVFNIMLQIFDEGRLTDSKGRLVDFKNSVIIMTSNVGATEAVKKKTSIGFGSVETAEIDVRSRVEGELKKKFKPEFLNRIDEIVHFNRLSKEECSEICILILEGLKKRLLDKKIYINFSDSVIEHILDKGYNEEYGARPLKRTVRDLIEDELSNKLIRGEIKNGSRVQINVRNQKIVFSLG